MNENQSEAMSLMDELANAGFGGAKVDFTSSSQEDFTDTTYTDPVARLNFSDMEDTTGFNENNFVASTPFVNPGRDPIECDDVTVDSDVLKGYTKKLLQPSMAFQENPMPVPHSNGSNPSSHGFIGLSLEQELQQAILPNDSTTNTISKNGCLLNNDVDVSKGLVSPCVNVGLSLEQELQQAISQNDSTTNTVSKNGCLVNSDDDVSKDLVSSCGNVGLSLEQELQQAISQNDSTTNTVSKNGCLVNSDDDVSKDLVSSCGNVGLSLEQELQQAISQNGNVDVIENGSPLKTDLNSSKDEIPSTDEVTFEPQNESLNRPKDLMELEERPTANKELLSQNKMEISVFRETLDSKQEPELAESSSSNNEIDNNDDEVFDDDKTISEQDRSGEPSRHNITNNGCTPSKNNNNNNDEVLNTLGYLGFDSERLKSFSDSSSSNMAATSPPVHMRESEDVNVSSMEKDDSPGRNKRSLEMEPCLSLKADTPPEKKTKINSGIQLNDPVSETMPPEIGLKQDESAENNRLDFGTNNEHSDCAQLKKQIEILEEQLENEQQLKTRAAVYGMQVLEENSELKDKVENLFRKIAATEEDRENERHAAKLRFQNKDYMEQQYNEEISLLKVEKSKVKEDLVAAEKEMASLSLQLKSMEYSAEQSQLKEQQLTTTIEHLQKLLQQKADQEIHNASILDHTDTEQITTLQQEIVELQNNNTLLKSQLISHEANVKRLEETLTLSHQSKEQKDQEMEEMKCEMNSYHKTLDIAQTEILDLKAQLHASHIENVSRKDRGNSLFSEIEDRRVLSEKMVATLQRNYQALKERYDVEKQQHHKLKMQAVSLSNMNSGKVSDDYVKQLDSMLKQSKNEAKELQEKLRKYQDNEVQQTEQMLKMQVTLGTEENKDFTELLNSLNEIKQKELKEVKEKLNDMEMQYLQEQSKVIDYIKKLRQVEDTTQTLRRMNMKLKLRNEELLMKYNPDELSEEKVSRKTYVEKIPLGPSENIAKSLMKTIHKPTQSKGPAENQTKTRAQQIAELVRCGALNPVDLLKESPKVKKSVSLSSEVTVIDNNGKKKVNMADENSPAKRERRQPPKGKIASPDKIIEAKSRVHMERADCKQQ